MFQKEKTACQACPNKSKCPVKFDIPEAKNKGDKFGFVKGKYKDASFSDLLILLYGMN
jgi:hypothetical protein